MSLDQRQNELGHELACQRSPTLSVRFLPEFSLLDKQQVTPVLGKRYSHMQYSRNPEPPWIEAAEPTGHRLRWSIRTNECEIDIPGRSGLLAAVGRHDSLTAADSGTGKTNEPLVSIITTALNSEQTIEATIRSVLNQTFPSIEYIIVDGGSTDGTIEIIDRYRGRIRQFLSEPDRGIYDGMNKGIGLANGDIVGILNSDDVYVSEGVVEMVVRAMTEKHADICWGDVSYTDAKNSQKIVRHWTSSEYAEGRFRTGWHPPHPSFFVRKCVYQRYGMFSLDFSIAADYELMLRFLERHKVRSCYIPQTLVSMRVGGKSNASLFNIVKANIECYRAWRANGLSICRLRILLKPLSKIPQLFSRQT